MRTKRYLSLLFAALMALALTACGAEKATEENTVMSIQPAQLSEEETALTELLGLEMKSYRIFDFQASGAQSIQIAAYELLDGKWAPVTTGQGAFEPDGAGRICLAFGKMNEGVSVRFQSGTGGGGMQFAMPGGDGTGLFYANSTLTSAASVEFDQEIPLAIQIATAQSEIDSYDVQYFGMPREYAKHGYEHVYAITVTFSQKPVSELSQDAPSSAPADTTEPIPES